MNGVSKYSSFTPAGSPSWIAGLLPNWQGGTFDGWRHAKSVYAVDFANARAMNDGRGALVETSVTNMRASPAYLEGDDGAYRKFDINKLAIMDAAGAVIGGQFTNKIRNPRGEGGTVGVIGAGGELPTNWASVGGLAPELVGTGTEDGLPYVDVRYYGVASTASTAINFETNTQIAAVAGQAFGMDLRAKYVSTPLLPPTSIVLDIQELDASGVLAANSPAAIAIDTTAGVKSFKKVFGSVTAAYALPLIAFRTTVAASYDFTIRIYAPKLVQVAVVEGAEKITAALSTYNFATPPWSIDGSGYLVCDGSQVANSEVLFPIGLEDRKTYKSVFNLSAAGGSSTLQTQWGGPGATTLNTGAGQTGTITQYGVAVGTGINPNFRLIASSGETFTITSASLKPVTPGYLPTFPILPPVGVPGDSVRYEDVVRAITDDTQPFSRWVAAGLDEGGSAIVSLALSHVGDGAMRSLFEISDGSVDNYVRAFLDEDDRVTFEIVAGRIVQASVALALPVAVGPASIICTWTADGGYICDDSGQMASFSEVTLPVRLAQMQLGGSLAATYLDDAMRQIQVCLPLTQSEATFWVQMI